MTLSVPTLQAKLAKVAKVAKFWKETKRFTLDSIILLLFNFQLLTG